MKLKRVLFVCMGNICRSPAAEGVMRKLAPDAGLDGAVESDSAGTITLHGGEPADARMRATAARRGYTLDSNARGVREHDFYEFDWIVAMDRANLRNLQAMRPADATAEIRMFCDSCMEHTDREVPDPYYGGDAGFEHVMDLIEDGCRGLLVAIREEET